VAAAIAAVAAAGREAWPIGTVRPGSGVTYA